MTPVNDAPVPKPSSSEAMPLVPYKDEDNTGIRVSNLTSLFYSDVDNQDLGAAIIFADNSSLGRWQVMRTGEEDWENLEAGQKWPVPEGLSLEFSYRGVVRVEDYRDKLACHYEAINWDNFTLLEEEDLQCWRDVRREKCEEHNPVMEHNSTEKWPKKKKLKEDTFSLKTALLSDSKAMRKSSGPRPQMRE